MRILAIGIGNILRTDDGIGLHVIKKIKEIKPEIDTVDAGLGSIEILEYMEGYDLVFIIDAIEADGEPGTIYKINLSGGQQPPIITHSHGVDLVSTINFGQLLYQNKLPKKIILLAVEAEDTISLGEEPTKKVKQAIDEVIKEIIKFT
ncbi:hydrogenase maturation protease [Candidatus Bathyarchaeota archaeon]|nr:hydrogenase maturation protease [Candidatus Bathyarchaeota archaeon]